MPVRIAAFVVFAAVVLLALCVPSDDPPQGKFPPPLAEGRNGVVIGTTGTAAVRAGLEALKKGGTAADAAMTTALAQVVECGGSYVSHAGILSMTYFDAATGKPSGRTALVPGFVAGVQAAHDRFGKLPRKEVFAPAVALAEDGFRVGPLLGRFLKTRQSVLGRLPETKRVFTKGDGAFFAEGDLFKQPELAATLRHVADEGAVYMYAGAWAEQFVAAVRKEGGKVDLDDLKAYRVVWEEPLRTTYRGFEVHAPGFSSQGGVAMLEALHLLELADLPKIGHPAESGESLSRLADVGHCQALGFLSEATLKGFGPLDLSPQGRVKRETAAGVWQRMREGPWPLGPKPEKKGDEPPNHSDGVVVVDRWGNVAAVTHSINTVLWGDTGIFVGGVSVPDSATFQQAAIQRAGPGKRLPDPMCPLVVLRDGKPVLGSSAIGGGLHQKTLQVLVGVLDFGRDPQAAVEAPALLLPNFAFGRPTPRVEKGHFEQAVLDGMAKHGHKAREVTAAEAGAYRGYWVGVHVDVANGVRRAVGTRQDPLPSVAAGY